MSVHPEPKKPAARPRPSTAAVSAKRGAQAVSLVNRFVRTHVPPTMPTASTSATIPVASFAASMNRWLSTRPSSVAPATRKQGMVKNVKMSSEV